MWSTNFMLYLRAKSLNHQLQIWSSWEWKKYTCSMYLQPRGSSVSIVSDYELDDRAIGVRSPAEAKDFPVTSVSRPALGPTQPPVHWVHPFPGAKRGRGMTLTTHRHVASRSGISRSYTSFPPQVPSWRVAGQLCFFMYLQPPPLPSEISTGLC
jgi:hypothetical protein